MKIGGKSFESFALSDHLSQKLKNSSWKPTGSEILLGRKLSDAQWYNVLLNLKNNKIYFGRMRVEKNFID